VIEALLAILIALPTAWYPPGREPETELERHARYRVIAEAVVLAEPDPPRARLVLIVGWWESRYAWHVHAGRCRRGECDETCIPARPKPRCFFRARSPWQLHATPLLRPGEWRAMIGTSPEATQTAARAAARVLAEGWRRCSSAEGAIAYYARGSCRWRGAKVRAAHWRRLGDQ
jgi:hypothetical protein